MTDRPIALITGAASGLGLGMARGLADRYRLILVDRDPDALTRIGDAWPDTTTFVCDLADTGAVDRVIAEIRASTDRLALLINNAGITHRSLAAKTDARVIERVMAVDYFAPVRLTQGLLPLLEAGRGMVVNLSSMAGWMPVIARAGYCAAKAALHQYFETFRAEVRHRGVRVLMVHPSFIETGIERAALDGSGERARHPRSTVGRVRSCDWMVERIITAIDRRAERLFPDRFTFACSLLYRIWPSLFHQLMRKRFGAELEGF